MQTAPDCDLGSVLESVENVTHPLSSYYCVREGVSASRPIYASHILVHELIRAVFEYVLVGSLWLCTDHSTCRCSSPFFLSLRLLLLPITMILNVYDPGELSKITL